MIDGDGNDHGDGHGASDGFDAFSERCFNEFTVLWDLDAIMETWKT